MILVKVKPAKKCEVWVQFQFSAEPSLNCFFWAADLIQLLIVVVVVVDTAGSNSSCA